MRNAKITSLLIANQSRFWRGKYHFVDSNRNCGFYLTWDERKESRIYDLMFYSRGKTAWDNDSWTRKAYFLWPSTTRPEFGPRGEEGGLFKCLIILHNFEITFLTKTLAISREIFFAKAKHNKPDPIVDNLFFFFHKPFHRWNHGLPPDRFFNYHQQEIFVVDHVLQTRTQYNFADSLTYHWPPLNNCYKFNFFTPFTTLLKILELPTVSAWSHIWLSQDPRHRGAFLLCSR